MRLEFGHRGAMIVQFEVQEFANVLRRVGDGPWPLEPDTTGRLRGEASPVVEQHVKRDDVARQVACFKFGIQIMPEPEQHGFFE